MTLWLFDIFSCQSRPDFRFFPVWFSYVNHLPPPDISRPWEAEDPRGGENDFTQIQFLASISNFLSLTKWKFQQRSPEGWSGWVKYAPTPPLTARQMLMVGLLWWLRILDPARVTPLTINQWITVRPIVSGEDSVIWIQPALFSTYCWWSLLDPLLRNIAFTWVECMFLEIW